MTGFAIWSAQASGLFLIAPDGCRDLIWRQVPGQKPQWFVSDLDVAVSRRSAPFATHFWGWRMPPGMKVDHSGLARALEGRESPDGAGALLAEHSHSSPILNEALTALASVQDVAAAARQTGLGLRSFQRCVAQGTGLRPSWWRRLARVRRVARALETAPLAGLAHDEGFADQAHLTREFRTFFGVTPGQMRRGLGPQVAAGYGA